VLLHCLTFASIDYPRIEEHIGKGDLIFLVKFYTNWLTVDILKSLKIRKRNHREGQINEPAENTMDPLLKSKEAGGPQLLEWLRDDSTSDEKLIFWINGKPGAGKSTFMRYICENVLDTLWES